MPPVGFEPTISVGEWLQTYVLDHMTPEAGEWLQTYVLDRMTPEAGDNNVVAVTNLVMC